ncbi:hypothetical protein LLG96_04445 [bacterium]|nr:hypothetical protein [bacterium]
MKSRALLALLCASAACAVFFIMIPSGSGLDNKPRKQTDIKRLFTITWRKGPNLPQGFQDSDGGIIDGILITVGGFCSGEKAPDKPGVYPRGFLKKVWGLDLGNPDSGWMELPEFPGAARQELFSIVIDRELYCWGGFSYDPPFTYDDGFKLSRASGSWKWIPLPSLPYPLASSGICAVGSKIYIFGGADYDAQQFYTHSDRSHGNTRLGAHLLMIDTKNLEDGWQVLPDCPGTPRWIPAAASAGGKIYILGGATGNDSPNKAYNTVVDNWMYNPRIGSWERLPDLLISSGNFPAGQIVYEDRFIFLVGGYQYPMIEQPDGSCREAYGTPYRYYPEKDYFSDVFVFDTHLNIFGTASPIPLNNNLPMVVLYGDRLHLIGGETGGATVEGEYYGHHPDLYLTGSITPIIAEQQ